jgi:putative membrane protein
MKRWMSFVWIVGCTLIVAAAASSAWAQGPEPARGWRPGSLLESIFSTLIFGLIGIVLAILGYKLFDALTHFNLEQEICEKNNIAVAILCAAMVLGICLIVAAAVL